MRVRTVVAFATLVGGLGLAGWAAAGIGNWNASVAEANDDEARSTALPIAAPAKSIHLRTPSIEVGNAAYLVDLSLFNPQPMHIETEPRVARAIVHAAPGARLEPAPVVASLAPVPQARKLVDTKDPGGLTPAQVARIKANLRLSPDQEEYWRPVEQALLEIARDLASQRNSGRGRITISAEASQKLYWTAGPLLMSLREDQRREARNLARSMGLEKVASLI
jgi:hypothetical protein